MQVTVKTCFLFSLCVLSTRESLSETDYNLHTAMLEKPLAFLIMIPIAVEASGHLLIIPVAAVVTIGTVIDRKSVV